MAVAGAAVSWCVAIATRQKRRVERSPRSAAISASRARGHRRAMAVDAHAWDAPLSSIEDGF